MEWCGLCCSIRHSSAEGLVFSYPLMDGQSQSTTWSRVMSTARTKTLGKSHKVLEESVTFMLSVRRDAFLSELLCHSYQVSGVWVAKTVRRNKKAITASVWAQAAIVPSSQGHQLIAFPCQHLQLHLPVTTEPFSAATAPLRTVVETMGIYLQLKAHTYQRGPPHIEVLWWMSFQVMTFCMPVVMEVPMVKIRRCSKARRSRPSTRFPSGLSGR